YVARADNNISPPELAALQSALEKNFDMDDEDAAHAIDVADYLVREKKDLKYFTDIVNKNFEKPQRRTMLGMIWSIMEADGMISDVETKSLSQILPLLEMTAADLEEAKAGA